MLSRRGLLLLLASVLVGGSLSWTAAYGLRLRSEGYRREVAEDLGRFFELPCDVGRIRGHTFSSRLFEEVSVWLPNRRDKVFHCRKAIWREHDATQTNELDLADGLLQLGTDRWVRSDYRQVLRSGLGHDFKDLRLARVRLDGFEIRFERGNFVVHCRDTSGEIDMSDPRDGVARLTAYELNGRRVSPGVQIHARFLPSSGLEVSELTLALPEMPLASIGLGTALGGEIASGSFSGGVRYIGSLSEPRTVIAGELRDADLSDLTRGIPFGPLRGRLTVKVDEAIVSGATLTHFRGSGQVMNFSLRPFAPLLGSENLSGNASLNIDAMDIALGKVNRLRLSGDFSDLSLADWLRPLGRGSATGRMSIRVNNLELVGEQIKSADVELSVVPVGGRAGTIDRELLLSAAQRAFDFSWPGSVPQELLPDHVEYAECGTRLLIRDNKLRILGTHGPKNNTILTIRVFGQPIGVLREQARTYDLTGFLAECWARLRSYQQDQLREWLREREDSTSGAP